MGKINSSSNFELSLQEAVYSNFPVYILVKYLPCHRRYSHGKDGQGICPVTPSNESGFVVANLSLKLFNLQLTHLVVMVTYPVWIYSLVSHMLNKNTPGVKKVRGQSEAALQIGMCDQKL